MVRTRGLAPTLGATADNAPGTGDGGRARREARPSKLRGSFATQRRSPASVGPADQILPDLGTGGKQVETPVHGNSMKICCWKDEDGRFG